MRKHAKRSLLSMGSLIWGLVLLVFPMASEASADTIHFNSGTITATVSGYEVIGDTTFNISGRQGRVLGFGTVDGSCGFCGSYSALSGGIVPYLQMGIQLATLNGSALTLWGGILISGNSFLLPDTAVGSFTAIRPVTISGQFVSPDGTFYQLAKHGRIYINFTAQDGNWSWDSAKIVLVPEPSTLMLFGTGLLLASIAKRRINAYIGATQQTAVEIQ